MSYIRDYAGRYVNLANFDRVYYEKNGTRFWIVASKIIDSDFEHDREYVLSDNFDTKEEAQRYLDDLFI